MKDTGYNFYKKFDLSYDNSVTIYKVTTENNR